MSTHICYYQPDLKCSHPSMQKVKWGVKIFTCVLHHYLYLRDLCQHHHKGYYISNRIHRKWIKLRGRSWMNLFWNRMNISIRAYCSLSMITKSAPPQTKVCLITGLWAISFSGSRIIPFNAKIPKILSIPRRVLWLEILKTVIYMTRRDYMSVRWTDKIMLLPIKWLIRSNSINSRNTNLVMHQSFSELWFYTHDYNLKGHGASIEIEGHDK